MFIILLTCFLLSNFGVFSYPISSDNSVSNQASTIVTAAKDLGANLLLAPNKHRETAKEESEGLGSSVLSVYDNSQQKAVDYFNTKPIVDTIEEHEKYGNTGSGLDGLTKSIVTGYESFSNFVNKLIAGPENLIRNFSKAINVPLNNIGARLVGLA